MTRLPPITRDKAGRGSQIHRILHPVLDRLTCRGSSTRADAFTSLGLSFGPADDPPRAGDGLTRGDASPDVGSHYPRLHVGLRPSGVPPTWPETLLDPEVSLPQPRLLPGRPTAPSSTTSPSSGSCDPRARPCPQSPGARTRTRAAVVTAYSGLKTGRGDWGATRQGS